MKLPAVRHDSEFSVERALLGRRSKREYADRSMSLTELAQLLWAAQGTTSAKGYRTAPSAGGLFPLETYVAVGNVDDLAPGIYHYRADRHEILQIVEGDKRRQLARASLEQMWMCGAGITVIFSAVHSRTTGKYGTRGHRYVAMEAGHAAQNVALQALALGMGTAMVGAFEDGDLRAIIASPAEELPVYLVTVGY